MKKNINYLNYQPRKLGIEKQIKFKESRVCVCVCIYIYMIYMMIYDTYIYMIYIYISYRAAMNEIENRKSIKKNQ